MGQLSMEDALCARLWESQLLHNTVRLCRHASSVDISIRAVRSKGSSKGDLLISLALKEAFGGEPNVTCTL